MKLIRTGDLLKNVLEFNSKVRTKAKTGKKKKSKTFEGINARESNVFDVRESTCNVFKSGMLPLKRTEANGFKILTPRQML